MKQTIHFSNCQYVGSSGFLTYCGKQLNKETEHDAVHQFGGLYFAIKSQNRYLDFKKQNPNIEFCHDCLQDITDNIKQFLERTK